MSTLKEYLAQKRAALLQRRVRIKSGELGVATLKASASAEGRSGGRRIRIRDFQVVSDSPPDFAGYNLGPSSPELLVGALSSCLTHTWLIQAADQQIALEELHVEVSTKIDPRGGSDGHEDIPIYPHDFDYTVSLISDASPEEIARVAGAVEKACPILNLLKRATNVTGRVDHQLPASKAADAA